MEIINKLWESIFPIRPDYLTVKHSKPEDVTRLYLKQTSSDVVYALPFQNTLVRALIHELKFYQNEYAKELLVPIAKKILTDLPPALIVPIPLSQKRKRERGYNQVSLFAKPACDETPHTFAPNLLIRTRHTKAQTSLKRQERLVNISNSFIVPTNATGKITGQHIIIIDDVTTTGATLKEARNTLLLYQPASVTCFALAH